jgi:type III secretion protein R
MAKSIVPSVGSLESSTFSDPFYLVFFLIGIALLPFLAVIMTSFSKIVVVLSIARQAIGTAQTPPNVVLMSLAMLLTCFSMYPVFMEIYDTVDKEALSQKKGGQALFAVAHAAKEPMRNYLVKRAREEDRHFFFDLMQGDENSKTLDISSSDFIIVAPAFLISELTLAFQIGFLIYLPFLVIDMTVANLLMALGMQMLSPTTISLPFKILLFVLVDGWHLLCEGLAKV